LAESIIFSEAQKKWLQICDHRGAFVKTAHICTLKNNTKHATVTMTIAAYGMVLSSTIVFKGKPDGRIAQNEFSTYQITHHYRCQENA
jgi:hypothetical protein